MDPSAARSARADAHKRNRSLRRRLAEPCDLAFARLTMAGKHVPHGRCAAPPMTGDALAASGRTPVNLTGDTSLPDLTAYPAELDRCFVGLDMKTFAKAPGFLANQRIYNAFGQLFADMLHGIYDLDTSPRRRLLPMSIRALRRSPVKIRQLAGDAPSAMRAV